ncbi:PEP-CTERM sorting domain-containing protein [Rubritalea sp.]|uniref:PEP-CTERM sorting domain-containing protein n=1 Tax=Rubritalea sp. TaxID=2109375 RepID=UPI003EF53F4C
MNKIPLAIMACFAAVATTHGSTIIYSEDFSDTVLLENGNPYLGGYYGNTVEFGEYAGDEMRIAITAEDTLKVTADSILSSAGVIIDPNSFTPGAGTYTLSFDIVSYVAGAGDFSSVSIWSGSNYGSDSSPDALILDTYLNELATAGDATSERLSYETYTSTGSAYSLTFDYDGTSAIALFFGAENNNGFPFPVIEYDNITITSAAVPEPTSMSLLALGGLTLALRRKR